MGITSFNLLGFQFSVERSEIVDISFGIQIPKIIAPMEQWKRRILTPIGRVTVIKSLLIPKLNHLFILLPTPKKEIVSFICKANFEFLWKSKTDKVKRSLLTQDYLSGGMKLVDVRSFITSLKCNGLKGYLVHRDHGWIFSMLSMEMIYYRNCMILEIVLCLIVC